MLKDGCPQAIKNCTHYFSKLIDPQVRNTLLTDIACFLSLDEEVDEPVDITGRRMAVIAKGPYRALQNYFNGSPETPREAKILTCYSVNRLTFTTFTRHRGNSFVLVRRPSVASIPAQIQTILQVSSGEIYFIVQFFLKTMAEDPFDKYPVLQSLLWSQDLGQLVVINPQDVESHFAGLSLMWCGALCLAVISLSRVTTICSELESPLTLSYRNINYRLIAQHFFRTLSLPCLLKLLTLFFHSTYFKI